MPPIDSKKDKVELVSGGKRVNGQFIPNDPNESLTSSSLTPQQDFNLDTNIAPSTGTQGELARLSSVPDQFTQALEQRAEVTQSAEVSSFADYINASLNAPTREETESTAFAEGGDQSVNALKSQVTKYSNQLSAEQRSLELKVRKLKENPQGMFGGSLVDAIQDAEDESLQRQADIAILGMAVQNQWSDAKDVADRTVDALMARQKRDLDVRKEIYDRNQTLFTEAEKRVFDETLAQRERDFTREETDRKLLSDTKLAALQLAGTNNAPENIIRAIQSAQTAEEVITVGGQYGNVDLLQRAVLQAQLDDLREEDEILVPTDVIDQGGRKLLINSQTGEVIKDFGITDVSASELSRASQVAQINQIDDLKSHGGFSKAVGPTKLGRFTPFTADVVTGEVSGFVSKVEQMIGSLTLDSLIQAKADGATFGALSEGELRLLAGSASQIGTWKRTRDDGSIYYEASEEDFMKELDAISNFAKLDAIIKGAAPEEVGAIQMSDGSVWAKNGDGSLTKLR